LIRRVLVILLATAAVAGPVRSAPAAAPSAKGSFIFQFENDVLGKDASDRHYTNGMQISYQTAANRVWGWLDSWARRHIFSDPDVQLHASMALGHNLYTPEDIASSELVADDRPYAAWLHADLGMVGYQQDRLRVLELSVGVVGPAAGGEKMQKWFHEVIGSPDPQGWHNQLRNEPAVMLVFEQKWRNLSGPRWLGLEFDASPHGSLALGNVFTYAGLGGTLRLGQGLARDFGPPRIQPAPPGSGYFVPGGRFGWYLFAGMDGRMMLQNIFLDGNTFQDSHRVDKNLWVADFVGGVAVAAHGVRLSATYVQRTPEFKGQRRPDHFGSLAFSFRL